MSPPLLVTRRRQPRGPIGLQIAQESSRFGRTDHTQTGRRTGASVAWKKTEWKTWKTYLRTNKEVFNMELYVIGKALSIALNCGQTGQGRASQGTATRWTKIYLWADLRVAIAQLPHTAPGPGQWLVRRIIARAQQLAERGVALEIHWVPGHMSVKGIGSYNEVAKIVAVYRGIREYPEWFTSLAHIRRLVTERKWKEARHWFQSRHESHTHIKRDLNNPKLETQRPMRQ